MPRPNALEVAKELTRESYKAAAWRLRDAVVSGDPDRIERAWHDYKQATGKPLDEIRAAHRDKDLPGMVSAIDRAYGAPASVAEAVNVPASADPVPATNQQGVSADEFQSVDVGAVEAGKNDDDRGGN